MKVRHLLAPNPGMMTGPGTNSWVVEDGGESLVIDPGPLIDAHVEAIEAAVAGTTPVAVLVTHNHPDHTPAANPLAAALQVPALGAAASPEFSPDRLIADGDHVACGELEAICIATPGHTPESVSYRVGDALFVGDHIMGGSTVVVEDMSDYMQSLQKLQNTGLETLYPGHGPVLDAPDEIIAEYLAHRREREDQIVEAMRDGASTLGEIVEAVYADVDPMLHPVASVSVGAHLAKLRDEGRAEVEFDPVWDSPVALR